MRIVQKVRSVALATVMTFVPAAAVWGANSAAGASPVNDDGTTPSTLVIDEESSTTSAPAAEPVAEAPAAEPIVVDTAPTSEVQDTTPVSEVESGHPQEPECGIGEEMDPCPPPSTAVPSTTAAPTTTAPNEEVCDDELNVAFRAAFDAEFEKIAKYRGYESYDDIPEDVIAQIDWEAFWNVTLEMKNQFGFETQEEILHALALCDICPPPEAITPPTTAPPTTAPPTTAPPTTAPPTTAPPTTAPPTTAPPTTAPPTTAAPTTAVPTTAAPTTAVPTTAPPATYPMAPNPQLPGTPDTLARTGGDDPTGLVTTGLVMVAAGAVAKRAAKKRAAIDGEEIAAGGPDPDLEKVTADDIAELEETDLGNIVAKAEKAQAVAPINVGLETLRRATERMKALQVKFEIPAAIAAQAEAPKLEIVEFSYGNRTKHTPVSDEVRKSISEIRSGRDASMITPVGANPTAYETTPNALLPAALRSTDPMANNRLLGTRYLER